jgi:hypothetical protein
MATPHDIPWVYNHRPFDLTEEELKEYVGFVYRVTDLTNGVGYIGKKFFWRPKTLPVTKTRKRKIKTKVQSDWQKYFGSSEQVKLLVEQGIPFKREILRLCRTKGECSYFETKAQFDNDVLLRDDYYNEFIGCKIHAKHLGSLKEDYNANLEQT